MVSLLLMCYENPHWEPFQKNFTTLTGFSYFPHHTISFGWTHNYVLWRLQCNCFRGNSCKEKNPVTKNPHHYSSPFFCVREMWAVRPPWVNSSVERQYLQTRKKSKIGNWLYPQVKLKTQMRSKARYRWGEKVIAVTNPGTGHAALWVYSPMHSVLTGWLLCAKHSVRLLRTDWNLEKFAM